MSQTIQISRDIAAPIDQVFALLSDHEGYRKFPGIRSVVLTKNGSPERNGVGAVRKMGIGPATFIEEITYYDAPKRFDYLITNKPLLMSHEGAKLTFEPSSRGTLVTWTSIFSVNVPIVGAILERTLAQKLAQGFAGTLKHVEKTLAKQR